MIDRLRKSARYAVANALYYSGILWLIAAARFRRGGFILMYHRVLPEGADTFSADSIVVRPRTFARQMAFLKRHFRILSVPELEQHVASGTPLPSGSCLVTFDDGWRDNFEYAMPILEQLQVPAIVFVATNYIDSPTCFWQERVARLMFHALEHGGPAQAFVEKWLPGGIRELEPGERRAAVRNRVDEMKNLSAIDIDKLEEDIAQTLAAAGLPRPELGDDRFMTWTQVRRLAESNLVAIGAHGQTHTPLTALGHAEAEREIVESRKRIVAELGRSVTTIAYPNGNFSDGVVEITRAAGYSVGFTTSKGAFTGADDPFRLPRINIHESGTGTAPELLSDILLIFQRLRRPTAPRADAHPRH
jgi:peptidoglycan/xylan/chitin deacetylase (PgdA/CDA1 family)